MTPLMGWRYHTDTGHDATVHVWPEAEQHVTEGGAPCWCSPDIEVEPNRAILVKHRDQLDRVDISWT